MGSTEMPGSAKDAALIPKLIKTIREHYGVMDEKETVMLEHAVGAVRCLTSVLAAYVTLMCNGDADIASDSIDSICSAMKKSTNRGRQTND